MKKIPMPKGRGATRTISSLDPRRKRVKELVEQSIAKGLDATDTLTCLCEELCIPRNTAYKLRNEVLVDENRRPTEEEKRTIADMMSLGKESGLSVQQITKKIAIELNRTIESIQRWLKEMNNAT